MRFRFGYDDYGNKWKFKDYIMAGYLTTFIIFVHLIVALTYVVIVGGLTK